MSKIIPLKDFGIPVPPLSKDASGNTIWDPANPGQTRLIVYYGPKGFTPSYTQAARIDVGLVSTLTQKTVGAVTYWDDPISSELPSGLGNGAYDFVFTLMDANGNEGDFSPPIGATVDTMVPPRLGQPVQL